MVEFGGKALHVADGGLNGELWGWSLLFGVGSLPIQVSVPLFFLLYTSYLLVTNHHVSFSKSSTSCSDSARMQAWTAEFLLESSRRGGCL